MQKSPRLSHLFLAVALFLGAALTPFAAPPTTKALPAPAVAQSDLPPDPAVHYGQLDNGFRYAIRANAEPKGRVSLRLFVHAGSFEEHDNQRGLAHFLEHMAFNGSTHYPPGTLVEFFQRLGMSFGGDTNASTSFDRTIYQIELPNTHAATITEGLRVFSDFAGGLLLRPDQIEKERGIILAEKRARDDVGYREFTAELDFLLGGTRIPARLPIGLPNVIEHADRPLFEAFYNTWYRPELMALVVVGDIDPAAVETAVRAAFGSLTARAPAEPKPSLGTVPAPQKVNAFYHADAEAPATTVSINTVSSYAYEADTAANRLKYLPRQLAVAMLNRRLAILAKQEHAPFSSASIGIDESFDFVREASLSLICRPDQWSPALAAGEQALRGALEHGFTAAELAEATANYRTALEQAADAAPTRHSDALAEEIGAAILDRNVFTTPATERDLFVPTLARVTPADCLAALRQAWAAPGRSLIVGGNAKIPGDAAAAIATAYRHAQSVAVAAPAEESVGQFAYTDFGPAGAVASRREVADLGITLVQFKNGVRLNLKRTPFEAHVIRLNARVGVGQLTEPRDQRGLAALAGGTFIAGGLGRHSVDDLHRLLAGKNVGVSFAAAPDHLNFGGATTPEDLLLELQLLTAHLVDPGYRPEALRQAREGITQLYASIAHTPEGPLATDVPHWLANDDPRFGLPPQDQMMQRNLAEVKAWLAPQLQHGAIELAIVGDLDVDASIADVARTLGALPPREPKPALPAAHEVHFPTGSHERDYTISSEIPKGLVALFWPTTDANDVSRTRRLNVLADILGDRLRVTVREKLGGTYSPDVGSMASDAFPGYGMINASSVVDPAQASELRAAMIAQAADLQAHGATDDELKRAKLPLLTSLRESVRSNRYWLAAVLSRAQEKPEVLDWARSRQTDVESISKTDIDALARQYLAPENVYRVTVIPAQKPQP
ncbi:insulinase family protein [Horticoccus luteus]|uniref:Insulinase family protein n=1 Tax=Horticoccus luteus TaxID=2862869 RepID=A0A8F9TYP7_9BACT|nr:M16 family metallopeptidase [Horticoccus luteus]QYM79967.1 insulinase family protein [Horticoccus luteus]